MNIKILIKGKPKCADTVHPAGLKTPGAI